MEGRPKLFRGQSDPVLERSRSRSLDEPRTTDEPAAQHHGPGNDQIFDHAQGRSSTSSPIPTRRHSGDPRPQRERQRVRFDPDRANEPLSLHQPVDMSQAKPKKSNFIQSRPHSASGSNSEGGSGHQSPATNSVTEDPDVRPAAPSQASTTTSEDLTNSSRPRVLSDGRRPAANSHGPSVEDGSDTPPPSTQAVWERAAQTARSRAEELSKSLAPRSSEQRPYSFPISQSSTPRSSPPPSPDLHARGTNLPKDMTPFIPLDDMSRRKYAIDDPDSDDENALKKEENEGAGNSFRSVARRLMRFHTSKKSDKFVPARAAASGLSSGQTTPDREKNDPHYVERPEKVRRGVLGMLLEMYGEDGVGGALGRQHPGSEYFRHYKESRSGTATPNTTPGGSPATSPPSSGQATPKPKIPKWHEKSHSSASLTSLINSSTALSAPGAAKSSRVTPDSYKRSSKPIHMVKGLGRRRPRDHRIDIDMRIELEELLARHEYMIKSCKALMRYGAPTHRLEEYMRRSARKLQLDGQFLYMPGCMIISFDSPDTRTAEVKIVRESQGVDLGKLLYIHDIYKAVIHGTMKVQAANEALEYTMGAKPRYNKFVCIFFYGLASATVGPFAFGARPIDMPIAFVLGCILGFLQHVVAAKSESYMNIFEISAAVVTSFAARGFGSINGGNTFCFSALAQSAIALILPGFIVLSAALELQSRNMVAGSVRMVYAIIYSLFLGFGITIGVAFYGAMDLNATSDTTCIDSPLSSGYWKFLFVPIFTLSLCVVNQAKLKQMPMMVAISFIGYVVNFFSAQRFASNAQIANTLGALAVGLVGNLYSRLYQGMSAAAMLPAIFVQVPSGIAASGSLISGVVSANQINSNSTGVTTVANGTQAGTSGVDVNSTVFNVGYTMIQIAIGLTVGLFFSSLVIYPFGKKRSGLFSF